MSIAGVGRVRFTFFALVRLRVAETLGGGFSRDIVTKRLRHPQPNERENLARTPACTLNLY